MDNEEDNENNEEDSNVHSSDGSMKDSSDDSMKDSSEDSSYEDYDNDPNVVINISSDVDNEDTEYEEEDYADSEEENANPGFNLFMSHFWWHELSQRIYSTRCGFDRRRLDEETLAELRDGDWYDKSNKDLLTFLRKNLKMSMPERIKHGDEELQSMGLTKLKQRLAYYIAEYYEFDTVIVSQI